LAFTAVALLEAGKVSRVLIADMDVHQGDGTAAILKNDPRVFTLSVHCQENFPFRKQSSTLDVALSRGTGDDEFLERSEAALDYALDRFRPDIVLFNAGVDIHQADKLGYKRSGSRAAGNHGA
jgi:acetoin utilization deacetylase AcuC-like enzyme